MCTFIVSFLDQLLLSLSSFKQLEKSVSIEEIWELRHKLSLGSQCVFVLKERMIKDLAKLFVFHKRISNQQTMEQENAFSIEFFR